MSLTEQNKKSLMNLARTSVDDARSSITCRERNGRPLTVEECEFCLSLLLPFKKSYRALFEAKARRAFQESVKNESADKDFVGNILYPSDGLALDLAIGMSNYSTLRKALYLATDPVICERIRSEIKARFPWGRTS